MSDEIMESSPIIFDIYYHLRKIITPNQNSMYLFIESIIFSLILIGYYYINIYSDIIFTITIFISFILIPLTNYVFISSNNTHLEEKTLSVSMKRLLIISTVSLVPFIILYLATNIYNILIISLLVIYSISLYWRSKKYLIEPKFYINTHSKFSTDWYLASIYLEKGIKQLQKENMIRSFYWFKKAQRKYEYLKENEDRISLKEGTDALSQAALFYSELTFVDKIKHRMYYQKGNKRIKQANQFFSTRFCDSCGKRKKIENVTRFDDKIHCSYCQNKQKKTNNNRRKTKRQKQTKNTGMTKREAKNILNVSKPLTESNIKDSYRKKVKHVHPDVGGSEKEFIKVKNARNRLLEEI